MNPIILPIAMLTLSALSSVVYAFNGDWRHAIYWMAAAVITGSVTF